METNHFHIHRLIRRELAVPAELFSITGNVVFADFSAARRLANQLKAAPGELYAAGLIDELMHFVFKIHREETGQDFAVELLRQIAEKFGKEEAEKLLLTFVTEFPPADPSIATGAEAKKFLDSLIDGTRCRDIEAEELVVLWLTNQNPALGRLKKLFDDSGLAEKSCYTEFGKMAENYGKNVSSAAAGNAGMSLIDFLLEPSRRSPDSLLDQLQFILEHWGVRITGSFTRRLLLSSDILKEEKMRMADPNAKGHAFEFNTDFFRGAGDYGAETESFSRDSLWMPRLIMLVKNTYVWLDQLSKQYGRRISRIDQIPDEELKTIADRGFTGLWLIGIWERSRASKRIKQLMGNSDATASAYSLYDYEISNELGGEPAVQNLRERANRLGIRLACDMVPNHTAIDSRWMSEHPEWFISTDDPPFPSYSFTGENLSGDPKIGVYIEDHYFTKTDAAVVFKRVDFTSGKTSYIYHGNDGTCMPWNDTAQLNYLLPELREQVIRTIIRIAKSFPIIRFDAAMTLAKRHFHRLWYPEPGHGGDIASRAEHGMTIQEFNAAFPKEFWREVVDRVAAEAPDTLLLAEAFWLMESYFVRTLGMHRVYNSAFMNFMKNEENAKFRNSIKSTLEFDPQILGKFVNFLNNPDEETAAVQFGTNDKYFGVTAMMVTMPGLPLFGHGQIEGFTEKYGMEFTHALLDEKVNEELVRRHEREIFPLMRQRHLFAHSDNFYLYDFHRDGGGTDEDVIAYSNGCDGRFVLVFFHNKFSETSGSIKVSAKFKDKPAGRLLERTVTEALRLDTGRRLLKYRELVSGEVRYTDMRELCENGFRIGLKAYEYRVFTDFEAVDEVEKREDEMDYQMYIDIFNSEVVPALGCTEPIAVALAAATSAKLLGSPVERVELFLSGNIMKNGLGVGIPGTGMVGLPIAAALGVKGGDPSKELEVLEGVTAEQIAAAKEFVKADKIDIAVKEKVDKLYIEAICKSGSNVARTVICGCHTNIVLKELNGEVLFQKQCGAFSPSSASKPEVKTNQMTVEGIWNFINKVPLEKIEYVLEGAEMNRRIAMEGLSGDYGLRVGKTLRLNVSKGLLCDDLANWAMALTAAASDARMAGCTLSVMSNSGSGNQGITVMLPIVAVAERINSPREKLIRALYLGNLIAIHLKEFMSKLSALCGTVTASTGAACGITYLFGGTLPQINYTIKNMIGNISGVICDGAKSGCALKVSTTINAALQSALLAVENIEISELDGIIEKNIEKTIRNLATVASEGMETTDKVILDIMTCK